MSIWEELGQKITQGSQEVLQKARDISGVVTLNSDISDSKRKIRDLYGELGEMLVKEAFEGMTSGQLRGILEEENTDDHAREIILRNWREIYTKVMFIRSEEEVITLNEGKIEELKAARICPRCGCKLTRDMFYCPECGAKVARPDAESAAPADGAPGAKDTADEKTGSDGGSAETSSEDKAPETGVDGAKEADKQEV